MRLRGVATDGDHIFAAHSADALPGGMGDLRIFPRQCSGVTGLPPVEEQKAPGASLAVFPNPMREQAEVRFAFPVTSPATVEIFDVSGRLVRRLHEQADGRGSGVAYWDGKSDEGLPVSSGVYFVRAHLGEATEVARLAVIR